MRAVFLLCGLLCGVLAVSSCAVEPYHFPVAQISPTAKTVAVISAFGDDIHIESAGVTAFGNVDEAIDLREWDLQGLVANSAVAALEPRFEAFRPNLTLMLPDDLRSKNVGEAVHARIPAGFVADLYLVFWKSPDANGCPGTPSGCNSTGLEGVGITKLQSPFGKVDPIVHAFLMVSLIDGKSFQPLATSRLLVDTYPGLSPSQGPFPPQRPLKDFDWHYHWAELSEQSRQGIRESFQTLIPSAVSFTIEQIGLKTTRPGP